MTIERLLITAACSWYLAYAATNTDGVFGMFRHLREWRGGYWHGRRYNTDLNTEFIEGTEVWHINQTLAHTGLLDCIICLIFWIALMIGFLQGLTIIESIAAAGIALWLHGYSGWRLNL